MASWFRLTSLLLVAAIATWSASPGFASGDSAAAQPSVRVAHWEPLVLRGTRFRPLERVVVRVLETGSPTVVKRVRASRRGTFSVTLPVWAADRCNGPSILVTGAGGRVVKVLMPLPLCPPALP